MPDDQFDRFLNEATAYDPESDASIGRDPLFGLYTSWCSITCTPACTEASFWAAMQARLGPSRRGLHMKGPAAADYFLNSYPALV